MNEETLRHRNLGVPGPAHRNGVIRAGNSPIVLRARPTSPSEASQQLVAAQPVADWPRPLQFSPIATLPSSASVFDQAEKFFPSDLSSIFPRPLYQPTVGKDRKLLRADEVPLDAAQLLSDSAKFGPEYGAAHQHLAYVPVIPVDRGQAKISSYQNRGSGYRVSSLTAMHYLTAALKSLEPRIDDDFIDRLNYYYTSSVVVMFAILVSAKQYVGHPIECWVPAQFTKAMEQYTENYCWVQNTYWVPFGDLIPNRIEDRERRQIGYYQWVPFILAIEALMFYIPATVWRLLNTQSGINVHGILQMACNEHNIEPENRAKTVHILCRHINDALQYQRDFGNKNRSIYLWAFIRLGKYYGAYVTLLYCFAKLLYLCNVFGQFFLLNRFLETHDYPLFGAHVLLDLLQGQEWRDSGKFPRVTLCDFEIRVLGNIHRHTVQCVLVINMFTEKIFVFLWLWFLFLTLCTFTNLIFWVTTLITPSLRIRFVLKYLELSDTPPHPDIDRKHLRRFVVNFLRPDGIFILRMVAAHAGTILCTELTHSLWLRYRESIKSPRIYDDPPPSSSASTVPLPGELKLDKIVSDPTDEEREANATETDPWVKNPQAVLPNKSSGAMKLSTASSKPVPKVPAIGASVIRSPDDGGGGFQS